MPAATPKVISELQGQHHGAVNDAMFITEAKALISAAEDNTVLIWLQRADGSYWPSAVKTLPCPASCLAFIPGTRRLFVGLGKGPISEYTVSADFNTMEVTKSFSAHTHRVADMHCDEANNWLISCGQDKYAVVCDLTSGKRLSTYALHGWGSALQYDQASNNVFVGDYSGKINVLKVREGKISLVSVLEGHSGSIRSLLWSPERKMLYSGSFDTKIIVWDIGGGQGTYYELSGHRNKVRGLAFVEEADSLLSTGDDGMLVMWNMKAERQQLPEWKESNLCELCKQPFFWNVGAMWNNKAISLKRQHHCRRCGKAVCATCSHPRKTYPVMGFEFPVRFCVSCAKETKDEDRKPLAKHFPMQHEIINMRYEPTTHTIILTSKDGSIKILDTTPILAANAAHLTVSEAHDMAKPAEDAQDSEDEEPKAAPGGFDSDDQGNPSPVAAAPRAAGPFSAAPPSAATATSAAAASGLPAQQSSRVVDMSKKPTDEPAVGKSLVDLLDD